MAVNPLCDPATRIGKGFLQMERRIKQLEDQFPWLKDSDDEDDNEMHILDVRELGEQGTQTDKILDCIHKWEATAKKETQTECSAWLSSMAIQTDEVYVVGEEAGKPLQVIFILECEVAEFEAQQEQFITALATECEVEADKISVVFEEWNSVKVTATIMSEDSAAMQQKLTTRAAGPISTFELKADQPLEFPEVDPAAQNAAEPEAASAAAAAADPASTAIEGSQFWLKQALLAQMGRMLKPMIWWRWLLTAAAGSLVLQRNVKRWFQVRKFHRLAAVYLHGPDAPRLRRHNTFVQRLVRSEKAFLSSLQTVLDSFPEMGVEASAIFAGLEKLIAGHKKLLEGFTVAHDLWPRCGPLLPHAVLLDDLVATYEAYVLNTPAALQLIRRMLHENRSFLHAARTATLKLQPSYQAIVAEFDVDTRATLISLLLLPLQRFPVYSEFLHYIVEVELEGGPKPPELEASQKRIEGILAHVRDVAAAHLYSFHQRFSYAAEVVLALPQTSSDAPRLRARVASATAQVAGVPVAVVLHLFSDVLVWAAQNPGLGGEVVLGVLPLHQCKAKLSPSGALRIQLPGEDSLTVSGPSARVTAFWLLQIGVAIQLQMALDCTLPALEILAPLSPDRAAYYQRIRDQMNPMQRPGKASLCLKLEGEYGDFKKEEFCTELAKHLKVDPAEAAHVASKKLEEGGVEVEATLKTSNLHALQLAAAETTMVGTWKLKEPPVFSEVAGGERPAPAGEEVDTLYAPWAEKLLGLFDKTPSGSLAVGDFALLLRSYEDGISMESVENTFKKYAPAGTINKDVIKRWLKGSFGNMSPEEFEAGMTKLVQACQASRSAAATAQIVKGDEGNAARYAAEQDVQTMRNVATKVEGEYSDSDRQAIAAEEAAAAAEKHLEEISWDFNAAPEAAGVAQQGAVAARELATIEREEANRCKEACNEAQEALSIAEEALLEVRATGASYVDVWLFLKKSPSMEGSFLPQLRTVYTQGAQAVQIAFETEVVMELSAALDITAKRLRVMSTHGQGLAMQMRITVGDGQSLLQVLVNLQEQAVDDHSALRHGPVLRWLDMPSTPPAVFGGYSAITEEMPRLGLSPRVRPLQTQVTSTNLELRAMLRDPEVLKCFLAYLARTKNAGPLLFFQRVDEYRQAQHEAVREAIYDVVWWLHLAPHAFFRVHLRPDTLATIADHTNLQSFPTTLLDGAQAWVKLVLENKLIPDFGASAQTS